MTARWASLPSSPLSPASILRAASALPQADSWPVDAGLSAFRPARFMMGPVANKQPIPKQHVPEEDIHMEKIWLKHYPAGVPADIDPNKYQSIRDLFEESVASYRDRPD